MRTGIFSKRGAFICRIVLVSLCVLFAVSVYLTSDLYAKYVTQSDAAAQADVAKFVVNVKGNDHRTINLDIAADNLAPGATVTRIFAIEYDSEVAAKFSVAVADYKAMGLTYTVKQVDPTSDTEAKSLTPGTGAGEFGNSVILNEKVPAGTKTYKYELTITYPENKPATDAGKVERIELKVRAVQID